MFGLSFLNNKLYVYIFIGVLVLFSILAIKSLINDVSDLFSRDANTHNAVVAGVVKEQLKEVIEGQNKVIETIKTYEQNLIKVQEITNKLNEVEKTIILKNNEIRNRITHINTNTNIVETEEDLEKSEMFIDAIWDAYGKDK
jgi:predicted Zn-dependent protease